MDVTFAPLSMRPAPRCAASERAMGLAG